MEKLRHVIPSKEYEEKAIAYINEFKEYGSQIHGTGSLHKYLDNYDGWLEHLEEVRNTIPSEEKVPAETFFLVRESDDKIIGMINIRLVLNEHLKELGGHIGYSIRPTERRKGYNKVNLYLGLLFCQEHGIDKVLLDCDKDNLGSAKTMQALGGILAREYFEDKEYHCMIQDYTINVNEAINKYRDIYEPMISKEEKIIK